MRVMFFAAPFVGHAFPLVPLAWTLRSAGHEVFFATGADGIAVQGAGFPVIDVMQGITSKEVMERFAIDEPGIFAPVEGGADSVQDRLPLVLRAWDRYADSYVRAAEAVRPDVIVSDPMLNAGPVAAAKLQVPAVAHGIGIPRFVPEMLREHAPAAFDRHRVELPGRRVVLDIAPRSLMANEPDWPMRCVPFNGGGEVPPWVAEPASRPRVCVTLGSLDPQLRGVGHIKGLSEAMAAADADFILALGDVDASVLGELPPNVHLAGWLPLSALLPRCDAIVHHAGWGTTLTACDAGIPQLLLPEGGDRVVNADPVRDRGCALVASVDAIDVALLERLLGDEDLRQAAREVQAEMRAMPAPVEVAPRILDLAR